MGYAQAIMMGAGALMSAGGSFLEGRSNDIMRERLKKAANLPGVDTGEITEESLGDLAKYLPEASKIAMGISTANQDMVNAAEESSLPGVRAAREKALGRITSLFDEDSQWLQGVQRRGAALGLSSGLFNSPAGQFQTLRLSDRESMGRTQLGTGLLGSLIGSMRLANSPGVQTFLGPTPNQLVSIRSAEREAKQRILAGAATVPGQTAAWSKYLTNTGGALMGAGSMGMLQMPQSTVGSMPSGGQQANMMAEYGGYGAAGTLGSGGGGYMGGGGFGGGMSGWY